MMILQDYDSTDTGVVLPPWSPPMKLFTSLEEHTYSSVSLENLHNQISVEGSPIELLTGFIARTLDLIENIKITVTDRHNDLLVKELMKKENTLRDKLKYVDMVNYKDTLFSKPMGLQAKLIDLGTVLHELSPKIALGTMTSLNNLESILNQALSVNNKDTLEAYYRQSDETVTNFNDYENKIESLFNNDGQTKTRLENIVERVSDVTRCVNLVKDIDRDISSDQIKKIANKTIQISTSAKALHKLLKEGKEETYNSATKLKLADELYKVAKIAEFYSKYNTRVLMFYTSTKHLTEDILKL